MLVKFDFMVGFYFIKKGNRCENKKKKRKKFGIRFTLLEGAGLELAPEPAASYCGRRKLPIQLSVLNYLLQMQ